MKNQTPYGQIYTLDRGLDDLEPLDRIILNFIVEHSKLYNIAITKQELLGALPGINIGVYNRIIKKLIKRGFIRTSGHGKKACYVLLRGL